CLLSSFFFLWQPKNDKEEQPVKEIVIDDRINPYIYQGLTVEVLRMRNRGIIDAMSSLGIRAPEPPEFYYIVNVDGEIGNSSTVEAAGGVNGSGTFKEWDTFLKECRTNFKAPVEGQKTSDVKLTIVEIQRSGLFGRRENHVEKLSINLIFDYRTGYWTGDDYVGDADGYGRVLSEDYELRFNIYPSDYDHDWVPYWTEVNIYGTDPTYPDGLEDIDNDGIPTWWEHKYGYNPLMWDNHFLLDPDIDGISNIDECQLYRYGANPFNPDVFVEIDFMEKNPNTLFDLEHVVPIESQQMVIERLSQYGISAYFDDGWPDGPVNGGGEYLEFVDVIDEIVGGHMARWYKHNFPDERKGVFRYFVMAYNAGINTASEYNTFDHVIMDNSPEKTFLKRGAFTPKRQGFVIAQGILHELGHSMGIVPLLHYGVDNMPAGNVQWPESISDEEWEKINVQYKSVMNYNYMFFARPLDKRYFFEYSDGSNGAYDFNDIANLFLPTFTMDQAILESPKIRNVGFSEFIWTDKNPDPVYSGWELDENLTDKNEQMSSALRFDIDNAFEYDYRIYSRTDEKNDTRDIRIYTKPSIKPPSLWTLIAEGNFDKNENILTLYSFNQLYEEIINMIGEG
ncbi:MAG: hypothetical protein V1769_06960, partial [Thermoplasmatota archaeon]